jgi:hypothetical protein
VNVTFLAILPDGTGPVELGVATTDRSGYAVLEPRAFYGKDDTGLYLLSEAGGTSSKHYLTETQNIQVVAEVPASGPDCQDASLQDPYGMLYFRAPDDDSPILFTDFDDTLTNSSDTIDWIRIILSGHYTPIDDYAVEATWEWRNTGATLLGITAQMRSLRSFTRSELLSLGFENAYSDQEYYYVEPGYNQEYLGRSIPYLANDDYSGADGSSVGHNRDHCEFKIDKLNQLVDGVFGGRWDLATGFIGDTEDSDGCAARATGILWYALMEGDDVVEDTSDPDSYVEIHGGWTEALPIVCADAGLACGSARTADKAAPAPARRTGRR